MAKVTSEGDLKVRVCDCNLFADLLVLVGELQRELKKLKEALDGQPGS